MHPVDEFIQSFDGKQREIMQLISRLLFEQPGVTARMAYKIPFFYRKSWLCYLNPLKDGGIEFAFTRGSELSNQSGILSANGRKQVMGIIFHDMKEIPADALREVIHEAILLDELKPYNVRKKH